MHVYLIALKHAIDLLFVLFRRRCRLHIVTVVSSIENENERASERAESGIDTTTRPQDSKLPLKFFGVREFIFFLIFYFSFSSPSSSSLELRSRDVLSNKLM